MNDPTDAASVPPEIRKHALRLALEAVDGTIAEALGTGSEQSVPQ